MNKKRQGIFKKCFACEIKFYVPQYRRNTAKFCSLECQNHKQYIRPEFTCKLCNKIFTSPPSRKNKRTYCSIECHQKGQCKNKESARERRRAAIAKMRAQGFASKNGSSIRKYALSCKKNACMLCGYAEHMCCLDVHHIDRNPDNNDKENLAILCVMCHRKVHRKILTLQKEG